MDSAYFLSSVLLPGDGTDGSVIVPNYSYFQKPITAEGGATISTLQAKFGGSSLKFSGDAGCCMTLPLSYFTSCKVEESIVYETWFYIAGNSIQNPNNENKRDAQLMSAAYDASNPNVAVELAITGSTTTTGTGIRLSNYLGAATAYEEAIVTVDISQGVWHHLVVHRTKGSLGGTVNIYLDGVKTTATGVVQSYDLPHYFDYANPNGWFFRLGGSGSTPVGTKMGTNFNGFLDDVIVYKGEPKYVQSFTPPTLALDITKLVVKVPVSVPILTIATDPEPSPSLVKMDDQITLIKNYHYLGTGTISGNVTESAQPSNIPVRRRVRLYEKRLGALVVEMFSSSTGAYKFDYLSLDYLYYVVAFDYTGTYNAVIKDSITPEVMT
jgi:hypothetical protein